MSCENRLPDVDEYIAKSEDFAKPILAKLRKVVHDACPDVEEKIRWSFPHFDHKGMMLSMAAFKNHCAFTFSKQSIMDDPEGLFSDSGEAMGSLGKIESIKDLPSEKVLKKYIKEAVRLNDEGITVPRKSSGKAKALAVPAYLTEALKKNKKAQKTFEGFSTSHRNEYIEWITEAKQVKTRERRIAQAIEWLSEGKGRNWKYEK
ncbi:MAG: YdeI/OmpD-associated family protein [Acidobacteriota bacterium]|nr:MAG: YdeI/OmpD-associated family protein [Acidobacteriota bacterium]